MHDLFGTRCAIGKQIVKQPKSNESMSRDMTRQGNGACAAELVTFLIWIEGSCFAVNACVPMAAAYFRHGFITNGDGIKFVVRNGTDTF